MLPMGRWRSVLPLWLWCSSGGKDLFFEALIRSWNEMRLIVVSVCRSVVWGSSELVDGEQSSLAGYSTRSSGRRAPISETDQIGDNII